MSDSANGVVAGLIVAGVVVVAGFQVWGHLPKEPESFLVTSNSFQWRTEVVVEQKKSCSSFDEDCSEYWYEVGTETVFGSYPDQPHFANVDLWIGQRKTERFLAQLTLMSQKTEEYVYASFDDINTYRLFTAQLPYGSYDGIGRTKCIFVVQLNNFNEVNSSTLERCY